MLFRMIRKIKVSSDWFGCVLIISFHIAKVFSESVTQSSSFFPDVKLIATSASYAVNNIGGGPRYESDDHASDSEDEKKLRKAKSAVERKRKEIKSISGNVLKKFKSGSYSQLFVVGSLTVLL